jgi:hypothetical protein
MELKDKLRAFLCGVVILGGALFGAVMRPEDIEELLDVHNKVQAVQVIRKEEEDENWRRINAEHFCWRIWKGGRRFDLFPSYAPEPRGEEGSHLSKNSVRVAAPCTSQRARRAERYPTLVAERCSKKSENLDGPAAKFALMD